MKKYKENDLVIYTDQDGNRIDTFVIFDTDPKSGLTHINHFNLKVAVSSLELHPRAINGGVIPLADPLSFELFNKLKEKYTLRDKAKKNNGLVLHRPLATPPLLAKAS